MLQTAILLGLCVLVGLVAGAVCIYIAVSGWLLTMDGLSLALISLTLGAFFIANVAWSVHTGEMKEVLQALRKKPTNRDR